MSDLRSAFRALRATPVVTLVVILSLAPRHRRQHRDLLAGRQPAAADAAGRRSRSDWCRCSPSSLSERSGATRRGRRFDARRHALFADALAFSATRFNLSPRGPTDYVDGAAWRAATTSRCSACQPMLGTDVHRRGRSRGRRAGRRRGGAQLRVLAAALRRRGRRHRAHAVVERVAFTIVGVMPPGFFGIEVGRTFDVAVPIATDRLISRREHLLSIAAASAGCASSRA